MAKVLDSKIPASVSLPPSNTWSGTTSGALSPSPEALPTVVAIFLGFPSH